MLFWRLDRRFALVIGMFSFIAIVYSGFRLVGTVFLVFYIASKLIFLAAFVYIPAIAE